MGLNKNQKKAVEYLDGPLLVLAGPGTGKTQLLSAKVAHILEKTDALPENILCLTFTESGANNMRERLLSMVGADASGVNIHTYHALGSDILAQYKNYAENFDRDLDEPIDTVTQYKIIKEILENLEPTDILKSAEPSDIISTISDAKSNNLNAEDLFAVAKKNIEDTNELNPKLASVLSGIYPRMPFDAAIKIYLEALKIFEEKSDDTPILKDVLRESYFAALDLKLAIEEAGAEEKPKITPLTKWRNKYFEKDSSDNFRLKNFIANKKLLSLSNVMKEYEKYLEENNLFDFTDMIQLAVKALKEDDGFRYTLQERYQYILLDEFQDTNRSQAELINLLTNKEYTFIMAVGDDDQAIFAFQGANVSNMRDFKNEYNAKIISLNENYRSTSEILDFSHKISEQIPDSFENTDKEVSKVLTSVRNDEILGDEKSPLVSRHEFKAADSEYAWIAEKINSLIDSGEKQSEIAILTPKHKYITPLLPFLKSYEKINIAYEKRENVLEDKYIHELTTLARFIYEISIGENPAYRLLEILTFPFFEVSALDAVTALKSYYGDTRAALDYLKDSENEKLKNTAVFIAEMVKDSFETPLEEFIDKLLNDSNFLNFYAEKTVDFKTYNLYENLSVLREHIKKHVKSEKPRLKDFIDFLDDYEMAGEAILNTSPYQDSSDSVQIMTAYKSKGLEFKHVFIIATDDLSWGNSKGNNNMLSLPKNLEFIRHTGSTDSECLRLFFVAATRAKKTLTMTNSKQDFSGKTPKRLEYLKEYEVNDTEVCSPLLENTDVFEHNETLSDENRTENLENHWISSYLEPEPDLRAILEKSVEDYKMNASALTCFIDIAYAGPLEFYRRYIINGPPDPNTEQINFGNLIHATFEAVTNKKLDKSGALEVFEKELEKLDADEDSKKDMLERGKIAVEASLDAFSDILIPKDENIKAKAEVNLSAEHLNFNGIKITGKLDHININEDEKTIEIYDFKTGNFHKEKWQSHPTLYKYELQLLFYKLLLNLSPTYNKYKVTRAHILFVNPNSKDLALDELEGTSSELVHDKIYEFNDAEETDFKELLAAVYRHIKALDFIGNDSPLAITADSNRRIKDILEFVDLVKSS